MRNLMNVKKQWTCKKEVEREVSERKNEGEIQDVIKELENRIFSSSLILELENRIKKRNI